MQLNIAEIVDYPFFNDITELSKIYANYKNLLNKIMTDASNSEFSDLKPFQEKILKRVKIIHENMILVGLRIEELKLQASYKA